MIKIANNLLIDEDMVVLAHIKDENNQLDERIKYGICILLYNEANNKWQKDVWYHNKKDRDASFKELTKKLISE